MKRFCEFVKWLMPDDWWCDKITHYPISVLFCQWHIPSLIELQLWGRFCQVYRDSALRRGDTFATSPERRCHTEPWSQVTSLTLTSGAFSHQISGVMSRPIADTDWRSSLSSQHQLESGEGAVTRSGYTHLTPGSGYRLLTAPCHNYTFQNNEKRLHCALIDISEVFAKSEKILV